VTHRTNCAVISALEVATSHPELLDRDLATTTLIPEAQRMKALIDDLLLLARADERDFTTARDDVDLDDLAAAEAERLRRETTLDVRTTITPVRLEGDAAAMLRVLRNLPCVWKARRQYVVDQRRECGRQTL
jgi:signal transduction histidine kinase